MMRCQVALEKVLDSCPPHLRQGITTTLARGRGTSSASQVDLPYLKSPVALRPPPLDATGTLNNNGIAKPKLHQLAQIEKNLGQTSVCSTTDLAWPTGNASACLMGDSKF